jgi:2-polyprenyl-3-methyl-5-hydroxy-6-metoxy-1,4-benzoquinol methylase
LICPVCDSTKFHEKFKKSESNFIECHKCGFITIFPRPDPMDIEKIYSQTYYKSWGMEKGENTAVRDMKMKTASRLLRQIDKFKNNGNLLDIGCAAGHFLETAAQQGWQCYGVEISEYSATLAKEKFGDRIYCCSFEDAPLPEAFFDCIIMSDVLEHFQNPNPVLRKIWTILKEDGIMVVVTPDSGSLSARLLKSKWTHFKLEHLIYFNRRNINSYLNKFNFISLEIRAAVKSLNLQYIQSQFTVYPHSVITPVINFLNRLLPGCFLRMNMSFILGDMLVIARKKMG